MTTNITTAQIEALRTEAAAAGDCAQVLICDLATGDVVLDSDTSIESLRIASFISARDQRRIAAMTADDARAICTDVIDSAMAS